MKSMDNLIAAPGFALLAMTNAGLFSRLPMGEAAGSGRI
jgi:hypothetical protein